MESIQNNHQAQTGSFSSAAIYNRSTLSGPLSGASPSSAPSNLRPASGSVRSYGASTQTAWLGGPAASGPSAQTGLKAVFDRIFQGADQAKAAAIADRSQGISISDGLTQFKKEQDAKVFFKIAENVLASNGLLPQAAKAAGQTSAAAVQTPPAQTHPAQAPAAQSSAVQFTPPANGTPWTVAIDKFGQQAQTYLQNQSQQLVLQYIGEQTGLNLTNMSASKAADAVWGWLSGEQTPSVTAAAGTAAQTAVTGSVQQSAATAASVAETATTTGSTILGALGAAYSAFQLIDNWGKTTPEQGAISGATIGAYIGTQIAPGLGTLIGAGIGGIAGALSGLFGHHKHKDQVARDEMRTQLQQVGLIDQKFGITLADGTTYDISLDGGKKLTNIDGTERRPYNVDISNPLAGQVIGWTQPLAELLYPGNKKLKDDLTGYLTNAALSNAKDLESARKNVLRFYDQLKLTPEKVVQGLQALGQQGALGSDLPAYLNGVLTLLSGLPEPQVQPAQANAAPAAQAAAA